MGRIAVVGKTDAPVTRGTCQTRSTAFAGSARPTFSSNVALTGFEVMLGTYTKLYNLPSHLDRILG
jgi:hypothetical protein